MFTRYKSSVLAIGIAALAGCAPEVAPISQPPVEPVYTPAGRGLTPNEINVSEVRTFLISSDSRTEIAGVPCTLTTPYYSAKVVTPATVKIPSLAEKTPSLVMSCTRNGKTVTKTLERVNSTVLERSGKWYVPGLLGHAVIAAATDPKNSVFTYPLLHLTFK